MLLNTKALLYTDLAVGWGRTPVIAGISAHAFPVRPVSQGNASAPPLKHHLLPKIYHSLCGILPLSRLGTFPPEQLHQGSRDVQPSFHTKGRVQDVAESLFVEEQGPGGSEDQSTGGSFQGSQSEGRGSCTTTQESSKEWRANLTCHLPRSNRTLLFSGT